MSSNNNESSAATAAMTAPTTAAAPATAPAIAQEAVLVRSENLEGKCETVKGRAEQQRHYGLDCGDAVCFDAGAWAPGGEHVKKITARNVSTRTIKFKYELPTTKYFSMDFPTVITLSPGMHTVLDVAFRPVKLEEYDDFCVFHVHVIECGVTATSGKFKLPVLARIAALSVDLPTGLDFGFCPTVETTRQSFHLRNIGQIDAVFDWTVAGAGEHGAPFAVQPVSGRVRAGQSVELTASFCPAVASVYVTTASCLARPDDNGEASTTAMPLEHLMKISGISKFTHVSCSESELHFGDILVGAASTARAPTEREFVLRNRSLVRTSFEIARVESDTDPVFVFAPLRGIVPPESTLTITVRYTPLSAGTFTCDHFDVRTPGGNAVRLTCKGRAVGPCVRLWKKTATSDPNATPTSSINFQDVLVGKSTARVVTLRNESPVEALFHFSCQPSSVFAFDCVAGRVAPLADLNVTVTFAPTLVGNFYRRVFLLVQHQSTRFIDVLGTAFDDKTRPSPFQQAHVDAYYLRAQAGLALLSPDQLEAHWRDHGDELFLQGALRRSKLADDRSCAADNNSGAAVASVAALPAPNVILTRSGEAAIADVDVCHAFFGRVDDKRNAIVVRNAVLDFSSCSITQFPPKLTLVVVNNTHGKVTCTWRVSIASSDGSNNTSAIHDNASARIFQVFPESADITANGGVAEFRVAFQPTQTNAYYFAELEGYVAFKSNRTFRLVNVETFVPPWCVLASVCGNTFAASTEQFLSKLAFHAPSQRSSSSGHRSPRVLFPPCYLGDSVFQTIRVENASDTPALFAFTPDTSDVFACKPSCGYIAAKTFQLVQLRFSPRHVRSYTHALQCIVNNATSQPETIELAGICALPALAFEESSNSDSGRHTAQVAKLFIKPTAIGLKSVRTLTVANASRVPLVFRWDVPHKHADVFTIAPKLGRLNGNESVAVACTFSPTEIREYISRFVVTVKPISLPWRSIQQSHHEASTKIPVLHESIVQVQTAGTVGAILFEPETLAFETILVNTSARQSFFLVNGADCDLEFALRQRVAVEPAHPTQSPHSTQQEASASGHLAFSTSRGRIATHSRLKITATFVPRVAAKFTFVVSCAIAASSTDTGNMVGDDDSSNSASAASRLQTCTVLAEASFPTIMIEDIRVSQLASALAWSQFQCHALNEYLSVPLSHDEELATATTAAGVSDTTPRRRSASAPARQQLPSSTGNDSSAPAAAADAGLRHFVVPFSPAPLGSATERVFVKLRNPGSLIVSFQLRYPKEGDVEIEHWAETSAPSSADVRLNAIVDNKVFSIAPRRATLQPHESVVLALAYAYHSDAYDGVHDLPIYLEVDKGKRLVLELQGRTLTRGEPKLFVPQRVFQLSPVMIGEHRRFVPHSTALPARAASTNDGSDDDNDDSSNASHSSQQARRPPVQQIEVFNRGESAFRLEVGSNAFAKVNAEQFDYPVLRCATSSEIVAAKSSVFLEIEFNPIVATRAEANVVLKAHGLMGRAYKEAVLLTVVVIGYHPRHTTLARVNAELAAAAAATNSAPPSKQLLVVPGHPVRLNADTVDFGHVQMYSQTHQLVALENVWSSVSDSSKSTNSSASSDNSCSDAASQPLRATFQWDATHPLVANGTLQFAPLQGELAPGESVLVRVTVQATGDAVVVHHDVACFVAYTSISATGDDRSSAGSKLSPSKSSTRIHVGDSVAVKALQPKLRASVINRSTATQEAAGDRSKQLAGGASRSLRGALSSKTSLHKSTESSRALLQQQQQQQSNNNTGSRRSDLTSDANTAASGLPDAMQATPLFLHIYAHVLPEHVFEQSYPRDAVTQRPLQLVPDVEARRLVYVPALGPTSTTTTATRTSRSMPQTPLTATTSRGRALGSSTAAATGNTSASTLSGRSAEATTVSSTVAADLAMRRDVLFDVLETLVVDVLHSSCVQDALERQTHPLPAPARALVHAGVDASTTSPLLLPAACVSDDCHVILAGIMENTVVNILHELFHGDLERELRCVPRKTVFPPTGAVATTMSSTAATKQLISM